MLLNLTILDFVINSHKTAWQHGLNGASVFSCISMSCVVLCMFFNKHTVKLVMCTQLQLYIIDKGGCTRVV